MNGLRISPITHVHYEKLAALQQLAYPHAFSGSEEEICHFAELFEKLDCSEDLTYYGAYFNGELVGALQYIHFDVNFHGKIIKARGIAALAVDLLYKKRGIAKDMILFCMALAKEENISLFTLYPFNTAFYLDFGFGFGSAVYLYKLPPKSFKVLDSECMLSSENFSKPKALLSFYEGQFKTTHGMMNKSTLDLRRLSLHKNSHLIKAVKDGQWQGYLIYELKSLAPNHHPMKQKLVVQEMLYSSPEALNAFARFFHTQSDQIDYIECYTFDPYFHLILEDIHYAAHPEMLPFISHKTSDHGQGLLYRALDPDHLLKLLPNRPHHTLVFHLDYPREITPHIFTCTGDSTEEIHLKMSLSSFSSWIMGSATLSALYRLGQLETDHSHLLRSLDQTVDFEAPQCISRF